jgi:hypothetical protein
MRKWIISGALVASLIVPAAAQAGIMDEFDAADEVERVASRRYHIDPLVTCRQIGSKTFTCRISDFKGSCSYSGRASVRKWSSRTYRVRSMRISKSCF